MSINYNFSKGVDFPAWQWLPFFAGGSATYHGFDTDYDGSRYIYSVGQIGSTSTTAGTTQLWRFDTWNHGWQYLASPTSGNRGMSLTYDDIRNILIIVHGAALTSWQVFNLNITAISISGVSCAAWALTTITPVLPAAADYGATILTINPNAIPTFSESSKFTSGSTSTILKDTNSTSAFIDQMVGLQLRITSGAYSGQVRFISSVTDANTLTVGTAFGGAPAEGDTYVIELPQGTASSGSASTLVKSGMTWIVNQFANMDVVITAGTGSGQKRRIASNTADTLTLAAAVTGNSNTGNFSVAPNSTSIFKIQMSSDFMYYIPGTTGAGFYKIDLATNSTATTWTTLTSSPAAFGGGGNIVWTDAVGSFFLTGIRGSGTATFYYYNVGLNSWSTPTTFCGSEIFNTGTSSTVWDGQRKMLIVKESSLRVYTMNFSTKVLEPAGTMPYAAGSGYDGHRARLVTTTDGVQWLYIVRNGGAEFFRVPLEWGSLS